MSTDNKLLVGNSSRFQRTDREESCNDFCIAMLFESNGFHAFGRCVRQSRHTSTLNSTSPKILDERSVVFLLRLYALVVVVGDLGFQLAATKAILSQTELMRFVVLDEKSRGRPLITYAVVPSLVSSTRIPNVTDSPLSNGTKTSLMT